jgi:hypothetical protein
VVAAHVVRVPLPSAFLISCSRRVLCSQCAVWCGKINSDPTDYPLKEKVKNPLGDFVVHFLACARSFWRLHVKFYYYLMDAGSASPEAFITCLTS